MFTPKNIIFVGLIVVALGLGFWLGRNLQPVDITATQQIEESKLQPEVQLLPTKVEPTEPTIKPEVKPDLLAQTEGTQPDATLVPDLKLESSSEVEPVELPTLSEEQKKRLHDIAELSMGISEYVEGPEVHDETAPDESEAVSVETSTEPTIWEENARYTYELVPEVGEVLSSEIQKGDTIGKILAGWLTPNETTAFLAAAKPVHALTKIKLGNPFSLVRNPDTKQLVRFSYELDKEKILVVERVGQGFKAKFEAIDYKTQLVHLKGQINTHLSQAVADLNEGVMLAVNLADIFASEINFITDLREGDTFELLVEKRFRDKDFKGYGRILGAKFNNRGKLYSAYLYRNERGRHTYYDAKGENLHRALLKAPLSFLRVTSRYSMSRRHPVYGTSRPHQGIDYGAPRGTPIMAVGDGVVSKAGWAGGYGKQVIIRHGGSLESMYGHMSGFARGISAGKNVRQGQVIGYVGSTGIATGPHLDFRIKSRGQFVNPSNLVVPRDLPIVKNRMMAFRKIVVDVEGYLKGKKNIESYDPDVWLN